MTLVEVLVTSGILLLLLAVLTGVYVRGSSVWRKVESKTELLRELQVALRRIERNLSISHPKGVTRGEKALAYLSLQNADGKIEVVDLGPVWQKFVTVYVDADGLLREASVPRSVPDSLAPSFIEANGFSLDDYLTNFPNPDHQRLTHSGEITLFQLTPTGDYGSLYNLEVTALKKNGSDITEKVQLESAVSVRNI